MLIRVLNVLMSCETGSIAQTELLRLIRVPQCAMACGNSSVRTCRSVRARAGIWIKPATFSIIRTLH